MRVKAKLIDAWLTVKMPLARSKSPYSIRVLKSRAEKPKDVPPVAVGLVQILAENTLAVLYCWSLPPSGLLSLINKNMQLNIA